MKNLIKVSAITLASTLFFTAPSFAVDEYNLSTGVTTAGVPLGLHGNDAVTLSTTGAVADGTATYTAVYEGGAYYFSSQENQKKFEANPGLYLPQFGGYCAFAVSLGKKFDGDPRYADIVDGKLFVFVNETIFEKYKQDKAGILDKAKSTWPSIQHKAVNTL